ncbi:uncharacterized protein C8Q71DRAFT_850696 [Rhodofomes roseus]|uniref:Uncharacterized protein n=1 Tax=Rhodofomes roseus TaxID=34475 RepID=A0ABQ8K506_9APHY|nr:uncharacterized protein C8Q71DRAFT_850696 [Rhodofomes roseus]KAH9831582.1 hypothetical protein C8Q71DRAFT_850696 [Rhodofomes roseus]
MHLVRSLKNNAMSNVKGPKDPRRVYTHEDYNGPNNPDPSKPNLKDTRHRRTSMSHARAINKRRTSQIAGHGSTDTTVSRLSLPGEVRGDGVFSGYGPERVDSQFSKCTTCRRAMTVESYTVLPQQEFVRSRIFPGGNERAPPLLGGASL